MAHPNFSLDELENYLKRKEMSKGNINFGIAYVKKNFIKSKDLDEYLIDQSSITGFLTYEQNKIARRSMLIALISMIIAFLSFIVAIYSLFALANKEESEACRCFKKNQVQYFQTGHHAIKPIFKNDTVG